MPKLFRNFFAVVAVLASSQFSSAQAATLYSSSMTAPPLTAGNLVGQDGWTAHSGAGSVPIQVGSTGTTVDSTAGGTREDANVGFTEIAAGQTYYFGFDVAVTGATGVAPTDVYFAHFKNAGTGTDFTTRTFVTPFTGADFTFGLSPASSSPSVTWATGLTYGETYRVVGSYSFDNLETRLWVDPVNEASTSISATDSAANAVAAFALRQATANSSQLISNLAVGTSFSDVVNPVPEPSAGLLACSAVGLLGGLRLRRRVARG
ncbi:MAG: hypothetical protein RLZZ440_1185 [Planctomycetota bacterium]